MQIQYQGLVCKNVHWLFGQIFTCSNACLLATLPYSSTGIGTLKCALASVPLTLMSMQTQLLEIVCALAPMGRLPIGLPQFDNVSYHAGSIVCMLIIRLIAVFLFVLLNPSCTPTLMFGNVYYIAQITFSLIIKLKLVFQLVLYCGAILETCTHSLVLLYVLSINFQMLFPVGLANPIVQGGISLIMIHRLALLIVNSWNHFITNKHRVVQVDAWICALVSRMDIIVIKLVNIKTWTLAHLALDCTLPIVNQGNVLNFALMAHTLISIPSIVKILALVSISQIQF